MHIPPPSTAVRAAAKLPAGVYTSDARKSSCTALHKRRLDKHVLLLLPGLPSQIMPLRGKDEQTQQPGLMTMHSGAWH